MSIASTSSSVTFAFRSNIPPRRSAGRCTGVVTARSPHRRAQRTLPPAFLAARAYTPAPAYLEEDDDDLPASTPSRPSFTRPSQSPSPTTPESAKAYLTDLLHLPPSRSFPPALALQILTHKSYRFVNLIRHDPSPSTTSNDEWAANHNARLTFLGRRALASYLALFVHSSITNCAELRTMDFLRGRSLENKLEAMRVEANLGREVGTPWGVHDVMRWDRNATGEVSAAARLQGMTVEAILGAVFTQFGSPAAHRTFHLFILPLLRRQLRDPILMDRVDSMRDRLKDEFRGGIVPP